MQKTKMEVGHLRMAATGIGEGLTPSTPLCYPNGYLGYNFNPIELGNSMKALNDEEAFKQKLSEDLNKSVQENSNSQLLDLRNRNGEWKL